MKKQNRQMRLRFIAISIIVFVSFGTRAQNEGIVIDKIIAKVDDYIILKSDLERAYLDFLSKGQVRGSNAKCQILQQLVVNKMLMAQSEIDSIYVLDAEVNANLDRRMAIMIQQLGGEEAIENAYGKSIEQIKSEIFDNIKEQLTIQQMQSELTSNLKVTPAEVKRFFKQIPQDSLPYFSTEVSIAQIVKEAKPGKLQKDKVKNLLLDIRNRIESGESFATLAKQYSQDPGSAANGGQLGFYGRGELAPEYEATSLLMKPDEISMPVETQFGYHLIQLQEKRGNVYKTRHILIAPQPSPDDYKKTENYLDSLRSMILLDSITFQATAKKYSDDQLTSSSGGFFQDETGALRVSVEQLDPNIFFTIDTMKIGDITNPIRFQNEDGSYSYRIIYYKNKIAPHQANFDTDYQKIVAVALAKKKNEKISKWFEKTRGNVYIETDPEYDYCNLTN